MIMAVSFRLMLRGGIPVALLAFSLAGCGNREAAQPTETVERPLAAAKSPPVQNDTRPIIATFGDSIWAGLGVEAGKSFPDDLPRLIDPAGYRYPVFKPSGRR